MDRLGSLEERRDCEPMSDPIAGESSSVGMPCAVDP